MSPIHENILFEFPRFDVECKDSFVKLAEPISFHSRSDELPTEIQMGDLRSFLFVRLYRGGQR